MPDLSNSPSFQMKRELLLLLFLVNIVIAWIVVPSRELGVFWNLQDSKEQQHLQKRGHSIGRQIVEASYHNSGYKDFVDKFCPQDTTIESHDGFQAKFVNNCLKKAQEAGNTIGSEYNQKWPWWFHTLLRDGNFFFSATMDSIVRRNRTKGIAKLYFSFFLTITVISFGLFSALSQPPRNGPVWGFLGTLSNSRASVVSERSAKVQLGKNLRQPHHGCNCVSTPRGESRTGENSTANTMTIISFHTTHQGTPPAPTSSLPMMWTGGKR